MAKDLFHNTVKLVLEKEGWNITHDPYELRMEALNLFEAKMQIDLGAERLIAAEKGQEKIAVEVKSLLGPSLIYDLHNLVGQFIDYQIGLEAQDPQRSLFVAIPQIPYERLAEQELFKRIVQRTGLKIIVFEPDSQVVTKWQI
jgi:XisH protein